MCHCGELPESAEANEKLKCIIKFIMSFPSSTLHQHIFECRMRCTRFRWRKLNYDDAMTRTIIPNTVEVN